MTDIWRSFVAQRCLWELNHELEFHRADVKQLRNEHDLMRDFDQETVGYLRNERIRELLEASDLSTGRSHVMENLWSCYETLVRAEIIPGPELNLLEAWIQDCTAATQGATMAAVKPCAPEEGLARPASQ